MPSPRKTIDTSSPTVTALIATPIAVRGATIRTTTMAMSAGRPTKSAEVWCRLWATNARYAADARATDRMIAETPSLAASGQAASSPARTSSGLPPLLPRDHATAYIGGHASQPSTATSVHQFPGARSANSAQALEMIRTMAVPGGENTALKRPNASSKPTINAPCARPMMAAATSAQTIVTLRRGSFSTGSASMFVSRSGGQQTRRPQNVDHAAAHGAQQRVGRDALGVHDEVDGAVDEDAGAPLLRRLVVEEVEQDAHVERPQERRRDVADVVGQPLAGERFGEDFGADFALAAGCRTEPGQRMIGLAAVAEQRAQQPPVVLEDVDLRVKRSAQAVAQCMGPGERVTRARLMLLLDVVVVGADDGFLAAEVVVAGAERQSRAARDVPDRRLVEAAFAEERQRGLEDMAARLLAVGALRRGARGGLFEHVQRIKGRGRSGQELF